MPAIRYTYSAATPGRPASTALVNDGPLVQVQIAVPQIVAIQLTQRGQTVPAPLSGYGLVDTGASTTCIDEADAHQLLLPIIDTQPSLSMSDRSVFNVYPLDLVIQGLPTFSLRAVLGVNLRPQGIIALVGRDVLQNCILTYDGKLAEITLAV